MKNNPNRIGEVSSKTNEQVDGLTPVLLTFTTPISQRDGVILCNNDENLTLWVDIVKQGSTPPTFSATSALMRLEACEDTDPWFIASDMDIYILNNSGDTTKSWFTAREFQTQ